VWAGLLLGGVLIGLSIYLDRAPIAEGLLLGGLAAFGVSILLAMFGCDGRARARHITASTVTLDRVSEEFAEAVRDGVRPVAAGAKSPGRGGMELQTAKYYRGR
jgi:hypothetical protein